MNTLQLVDVDLRDDYATGSVRTLKRLRIELKIRKNAPQNFINLQNWVLGKESFSFSRPQTNKTTQFSCSLHCKSVWWCSEELMTVAHHKPAFAKFWQSQMLHLPDCWNRKKKSSMTFHLGLALFQCQPRSLKLVQFGASVNFGTSHYNACSKTW